MDTRAFKLKQLLESVYDDPITYKKFIEMVCQAAMDHNGKSLSIDDWAMALEGNLRWYISDEPIAKGYHEYKVVIECPVNTNSRALAAMKVLWQIRDNKGREASALWVARNPPSQRLEDTVKEVMSEKFPGT